MRILTAGILALAVCALSPARALADAPPDPDSAPKPWLAQRAAPAPELAPSKGPVVVRSLAATALLAGLAAAALLLRKRRSPIAALASDFRVDVLGTTRIGPKAHAVVAAVTGRVLLLGVTDGSVERLAWLDDVERDDDDADRDHDRDRRRRLPTGPMDPSASDAVRRRMDPHPVEQAARRAAPAAPPIEPAGSTFKDLLARWTKAEQKRETAPSNAASVLAQATEDVFDRSTRPTGPGERAIEGQARGLAARLQGRVV